MGHLELYRVLDRGVSEYIHVDDFLIHGLRGVIVVAGLAVCVGRIRHRRLFHSLDGTDRRHTSHWFSHHCALVVWYLGWSLASN